MAEGPIRMVQQGVGERTGVLDRLESFVHPAFDVATVPTEEPHHPVARPAAAVLLDAEVEVAAPDAIGGVGRGGEHRGEFGGELRRDPFVGVEREDPGMAGGGDSGVPLRGDGGPGLFEHRGAGGAGQRDGPVHRPRVGHEDLIRERSARHAGGDVRRLVEGRNDDSQREGCRHGTSDGLGGTALRRDDNSGTRRDESPSAARGRRRRRTAGVPSRSAGARRPVPGPWRARPHTTAPPEDGCP